MTKRAFLHIGPPKTGTTYIQEILWTNTDVLQQAGFVLPFNSAWAHRFASRTLRGDARWTARPDSARWNWSRLVQKVQSTRKSVIVSAEDLASARGPEIARAIEDLSSTEVHVIATARDLGRQLPSLWQNSIKNGGVATLDEYAAQAIDGQPWFWKAQDVPTVLRRWLEHIPADRVHLVTVPKAGPPVELWVRFAGVIGVDADAVHLPAAKSNASLGATQTEVLRRVNAGLVSDSPDLGALRRELIPVLGGNRDSHQPIRLPAAFQLAVTERAQRMVDELEQLGVDRHGDWDDLLADPSTTATHAAEPDTELDVALEALHRLAVRADLLRRERGLHPEERWASR